MMKQVTKKSTAMFVLFAVSLMISVFSIGATASAASAKLNKKKVTLAVATSTTLKVTGTTAKVTWSSSEKSVATVNSKGKVTAKKKGVTTITAKVGEKKLTCRVNVVNNVKKFYTSKQLKKKSTWTKIKKAGGGNFCTALYAASYNAKGELTLKVATANLSAKKTWKQSVISVRVLDKKGRVIAMGAFNMLGNNKLKPGDYNDGWTIPLKGSKTKKVIDLRNTDFTCDIVIN